MGNVSNSKTILTSEVEFLETPTGNYWVPKYAYQDIIVASIKQGQIFDEEIYSISKKYIKPDTIVLDVGANLGQMAVQFSHHIGGGWSLHLKPVTLSIRY